MPCAIRSGDFASLLRDTASDQGLALAKTPEFRFRMRYRLSPIDPRFLDCTPEQVVLDLWAWAHIDDPNLRNQVTDPHFAEELAAMEAEVGAKSVAEPTGPVPVQVFGEEEWETVTDDHYDPPS